MASPTTGDCNALQPLSANARKRKQNDQHGDGESSDGTKNFPIVPSGEAMLAMFMKEARRKLSSTLQTCLETFLVRLQRPNEVSVQLREAVRTRIELFQQEEPAISNLPASELVTYSGQPDARFGLMMHYPTFLKSTNEVLDEKNPCMKYMIQRYSSKHVFVWDLHWRQHKAFPNNLCPVRTYSEDVLTCHDQVSLDLLEMADLPLLALGGSCCRNTFGRWFKQAIRLEFAPIRGHSDTLTFFLDFRTGLLRRIAVGLNHPAGIFRKTLEDGMVLAALQDAATNFLFHVGGLQVEHNDVFVAYQQSLKINETVTGFEPLMILKRLLNEEAESGLLSLDHFPSGIILWALSRFEDITIETLDETVSRNLSIPKLLLDHINANAAQKRSQDRTAQGLAPNKKLAPAMIRTGPRRKGAGTFSDKGPFEYWDGRKVVVPKEGRITLWVPDGSARRKIQFSAVGKYQDTAGDLYIHFDSDGIAFRDGAGAEMWRKSLTIFRKLAGGSPDLLVQHAKELVHKEGV